MIQFTDCVKLINSIKNNDINAIKNYIDKGYISPGGASICGLTLLFLAIQYQQIDIMKVLLTYGNNITEGNELYSMLYGDNLYKCLDAIVEDGLDSKYKNFSKDHLRTIAEHSLKKIYDLNPLELAYKSSGTDMYKELLLYNNRLIEYKNNDVNALLYFEKKKDLEMINLINHFLKYGYDTDLKNYSCSCRDWLDIRSLYKMGDPRRLCKHIISKLDLENLPVEISKFKESIEFYQKKECGFKRDFDEIIELDTFTLLGKIDWINVFDENGINYGVKIEPFSKCIYWAKNKKPKNFSVIENFLIKESEKIPLPLEEEEYSQIISFIKDVLPNKQKFFISIQTSQYIPTSDGITYDISESKLTPEQEKKLEQELLQKYEENESYYKLGESASTQIDDEDEFCIYEALTVTNNEIIVKMYGGKKYKLQRNYKYIKQLKESRELKERLEIEEQKKLWQEELEQRRKIAAEKGYILAQDYEGELYDIQHPEGLYGEEYKKVKDLILANYNTLQYLINKFSIDISTAKFNTALRNLNFVVKESTLNQNNWILKGDGLQYGINLIKDSQYMHKNIPNWYKVHILDYIQIKLIKLESNFNIKMTSTLFEKNKFNELYQLVKQEIESSQLNNKIINETTNNKILEREKWLRHVTCPNCGEKTNIHKKDKRKRKAGYIQRFYCHTCNSMFQIELDKLEKMIREYQKNNKEELTTQKESEVQ